MLRPAAAGRLLREHARRPRQSLDTLSRGRAILVIHRTRSRATQVIRTIPTTRTTTMGTIRTTRTTHTTGRGGRSESAWASATVTAIRTVTRMATTDIRT